MIIPSINDHEVLQNIKKYFQPGVLLLIVLPKWIQNQY